MSKLNSKRSFLRSTIDILPYSLTIVVLIVVAASAFDQRMMRNTPRVASILAEYYSGLANEIRKEGGDLTLTFGSRLVASYRVSNFEHKRLTMKGEAFIDEFDADYLKEAFAGTSVSERIDTIVDLLNSISADALKRPPNDHSESETDRLKRMRVAELLDELSDQLKAASAPMNEVFILGRLRSEPEREWAINLKNYLTKFSKKNNELKESINLANFEEWKSNRTVKYTPADDLEFVQVAERLTDLCRRSRVISLMLNAIDDGQGTYSDFQDDFVGELSFSRDITEYVSSGSIANISDEHSEVMQETLKKYGQSMESRISLLESK